MDFASSTPPSIPEFKAYTSNESFMSGYYMFAQLVLSLPLMEGVDLDFYMRIKYDNNDLSDGARYQFALKRNLMMDKDLQPEYLRWCL